MNKTLEDHAKQEISPYGLPWPSIFSWNYSAVALVFFFLLLVVVGWKVLRATILRLLLSQCYSFSRRIWHDATVAEARLPFIPVLLFYSISALSELAGLSIWMTIFLSALTIWIELGASQPLWTLPTLCFLALRHLIYKFVGPIKAFTFGFSVLGALLAILVSEYIAKPVLSPLLWLLSKIITQTGLQRLALAPKIRNSINALSRRADRYIAADDVSSQSKAYGATIGWILAIVVVTVALGKAFFLPGGPLRLAVPSRDHPALDYLSNAASQTYTMFSYVPYPSEEDAPDFSSSISKATLSSQLTSIGSKHGPLCGHFAIDYIIATIIAANFAIRLGKHMSSNPFFSFWLVHMTLFLRWISGLHCTRSHYLIIRWALSLCLSLFAAGLCGRFVFYGAYVTLLRYLNSSTLPKIGVALDRMSHLQDWVLFGSIERFLAFWRLRLHSAPKHVPPNTKKLYVRPRQFG